MQRAIKYAADHRLRFFVKDFVPSQAVSLVRKLVRHGYDVREPTTTHALGPSLETGTTENSFEPFERDWH
jgi:hypothetical protein